MRPNHGGRGICAFEGLKTMFEKLFNPKSVAIIGASQKALSIGHVITKNLLKYGFKGPVYPVNPKPDDILGLKTYASIMDIPMWMSRI
jgi:acyl-CoA synthetase (NDP forming)